MAEAFVAWAAETIFGVTLTGTALTVTTAAVVVAAGSAYGSYESRRMEASARNAYNASLKDSQIMIRSGIAPRGIVYGRGKVSGPLNFGGSSGSMDEFLHIVVPLAGHECDAIETVYFNDDALTIDSDGWVTTPEYSKVTEHHVVEQFGTSTITLAHVPTSRPVLSYVWSDGGTNSVEIPLAWDDGSTTVKPTQAPPGTSNPGTYNVNYQWQEVQPLVRIRKHLGDAGQVTADADLVAECGSKWKSTARGTGVCYLYVRLEYNQEVFGQIGLPNISAVVRGKKVRDPRTGLITWNDNAALCTADYLSDPLLGIGSAAAEVPDDELTVAANICEEMISLYDTGYVKVQNGSAQVHGIDTNWTKAAKGMRFIGPDGVKRTILSIGDPGGGGGDNNFLTLTAPYGGVDDDHGSYAIKQERYTANGYLSTENSPRDNLITLCATMAGTAVWVQGRWLLRAGAYVTPVMTITEDFIADGSIKIIPRTLRRDTVNRITGTFIDPAQGYGEVPFGDVKNDFYKADDGGIDLPLPVQMQLVDDNKRAQRLAKIELERRRQALTAVLSCNWMAYNLAPSDTVRLNLSRYGWNNKVFEVRERSFDPAGRITYTLRETAAAVFDWNFGEATEGDLADNTGLPNPLKKPAKLTNLKVDSGTDWLEKLSDGTIITRAHLSWTASTDVFVQRGGKIDINYKRDDQTKWTAAPPADGDDTDAIIGPLTDKRVMLIRIRARNNLAKVSDWTTVTHTVVGKTEPPSNVGSITIAYENGNLRVSWPGIDDLDLKGYQIRIGGTSWETATVLVKLIAANTFLWKGPDTDTVIRIKAVDRSGNYSKLAASLNLANLRPGTPVVTWKRSGSRETISWKVLASPFGIDRYEIRYLDNAFSAGNDWDAATEDTTTKSTHYTRKVDYYGPRRYLVRGVDNAGNYGPLGFVDVDLAKPGEVIGLRTETVDNNVLLFWSPPAAGSMPILQYEVRKGQTWALSIRVGVVTSTFISTFEQSSGAFRYWVTATDVAGNVGIPLATDAVVAEPPDYILRLNVNDDWSGQMTGMFLDGDILTGPSTGQTWSDYFTSHGWTNLQDAINAGYPLYYQPSAAGACSYSRIVDYGAVLSSCTVAVTLTQLYNKNVTVALQISYRQTTSDPWIAALPNEAKIFATNFRYVKVDYTFTGSGSDALIQCSSLLVKLAVKRRTDTGKFTITNAANGVVVPFAVPFIDAETPKVSFNGATPLTAVVVFADVPYPKNFTIYAYNAAGQKVTASGSWTAHGYT